MLPPAGEYASGLIFLPRKEDERKTVMDLFEKVIKDEGQIFLGWRNVPQNGKVLGDLARREAARGKRQRHAPKGKHFDLQCRRAIAQIS